jgi:hypothetical protein
MEPDGECALSCRIITCRKSSNSFEAGSPLVFAECLPLDVLEPYTVLRCDCMRPWISRPAVATEANVGITIPTATSTTLHKGQG